MRQPSEPAIDLSPSPGDEVKTTTCYMCACRCGIKVWLADGGHQDKVIRYIQGNPAHPVNQGVICAKGARSEEHTSELQSLMRNSYAVFCLKKKTLHKHHPT